MRKWFGLPVLFAPSISSSLPCLIDALFLLVVLVAVCRCRYESDLQCADTQQRLRVIQGQLLETANFVNSISAANEANPAASALSTSQ